MFTKHSKNGIEAFVSWNGNNKFKSEINRRDIIGTQVFCEKHPIGAVTNMEKKLRICLFILSGMNWNYNHTLNWHIAICSECVSVCLHFLGTFFLNFWLCFLLFKYQKYSITKTMHLKLCVTYIYNVYYT